MSDRSDTVVLAADVGSSRVKLGLFLPPGDCVDKPGAASLAIAPPLLPLPDETISVVHRDRALDQWTGEVESWLRQRLPTASVKCAISSVHAQATQELNEALRCYGVAVAERPLCWKDLQLEVRVPQPERVGVDRLLNATAANRVRPTETPLIVVDAGTAVTVDLVAADGAFEGGAILPGPSLALSALHLGTTTLPLMSIESLDQIPTAVGKSTEEAVTSGVYWGLAGGVRRLIELYGEALRSSPAVLATGGAAPMLVDALGGHPSSFRHIPHLTLAGIAIASGASEFQ